MADLSINDLARMVGVPVERLLEQIKEAGLPQSSATDTISNEQRATLLSFLKSRHGDSSGGDTAPRKITLKRKTVETLKTSDNQGRSKSVNVEVRKKRTYVKRSVEEAQKEAEEKERLAAEQKARDEEAEAKAKQAVDAARPATARPAAGSARGAAAPAGAAKPEAKVEGKPEHKPEHKKGTIRKDGTRIEEDDVEKRKVASGKKGKDKDIPPKKITVRAT